MSSEIRSYTKLLALTHAHMAPLREHGTHLIYQEKVDGSQFSFRLDEGGALHFRSRRVEVHADNPGMFAKAVEEVQGRKEWLTPGWTYRGEYLSKPKHNTISYARVPRGHIMLFDIDRGHCDYITDPVECAIQAHRIGLEWVPTWTCPGEPDPKWLTAESILGGAVVEGYVVKDYSSIGPDGKVLMAKVVRESFKEVHGKDWKGRNPTKGDVIDAITDRFRTEARWQKAVQHLSEAGELVNAPQDIGRLMKEAQQDIEAEAADDIKEALWDAFRKRIVRGSVSGLPEWYKARLAEEG